MVMQMRLVVQKSRVTYIDDRYVSATRLREHLIGRKHLEFGSALVLDRLCSKIFAELLRR